MKIGYYCVKVNGQTMWGGTDWEQAYLIPQSAERIAEGLRRVHPEDDIRVVKETRIGSQYVSQR